MPRDVFLPALVITAAAGGLVQLLVTRTLTSPRWIDRPRAERHHRRPVSRTGGVAWVLTLLAAAAVASAAVGEPIPVVFLSFVVAAFLLGLADDAVRVPWIARAALDAGLLLAALLVLSRGPVGAVGLPVWWVYGVVPVLVLALHRALNIFDNIDAALGSAATFGFLSLAEGLDASLGRIALLSSGASLGFLAWNLPPARIFLGNSGSHAIACAAALLSGLVLLRSGPRALLFLLPFLWPLLDLAFVVVRRSCEGRRPWIGGRDHTTHALSRALGSDRALLLWFGVAGLGGLFAAWRFGPR